MFPKLVKVTSVTLYVHVYEDIKQIVLPKSNKKYIIICLLVPFYYDGHDLQLSYRKEGPDLEVSCYTLSLRIYRGGDGSLPSLWHFSVTVEPSVLFCHSAYMSFF